MRIQKYLILASLLTISLSSYADPAPIVTHDPGTGWGPAPIVTHDPGTGGGQGQTAIATHDPGAVTNRQSINNIDINHIITSNKSALPDKIAKLPKGENIGYISKVKIGKNVVTVIDFNGDGMLSFWIPAGEPGVVTVSAKDKLKIESEVVSK